VASEASDVNFVFQTKERISSYSALVTQDVATKTLSVSSVAVVLTHHQASTK
jgi:hypothetical protein